MKKFDDLQFGDIVVMKSDVCIPASPFTVNDIGFVEHLNAQVWGAFRVEAPKNSYYDEGKMITPVQAHKVYLRALMPNRDEGDMYVICIMNTHNNTVYYFDGNEIMEAINFADDLNSIKNV